VLEDEEIEMSAVTTVDILARFIRPVSAKKVETLCPEARVVAAGGRLVWAEADVLADGKMVGKLAATSIRVTFDAASYVGERGAD
jgi:acyl-coenzyme A thioesterase PaaI-like protein